MAHGLSFDERARIEAMSAQGMSIEETARHLGRHPTTMLRELARCEGRGSYNAEDAQADADDRAARPKTPLLAADPVLAAEVEELLMEGMSPCSAAAQLRSTGRRVCAETIYRACYDHTGLSGLPEGSQRAGPSPQAPRTAGPLHAKGQPAGRLQADSGPSRGSRRPQRGRSLGGRPDHRQGQPVSGGDPH